MLITSLLSIFLVSFLNVPIVTCDGSLDDCTFSFEVGKAEAKGSGKGPQFQLGRGGKLTNIFRNHSQGKPIVRGQGTNSSRAKGDPPPVLVPKPPTIKFN